MGANTVILFITYILISNVFGMVPEDETESTSDCGTIGRTDQLFCTQQTEKPSTPRILEQCDTSIPKQPEDRHDTGTPKPDDRHHASTPKKLDAGIDLDSPEIPCTDKMPCAWETYDKFTRKFDDFTKNKCYCVGDKKCVKDRDEVSIHSYVYLCKSQTTTPTP